MQQERDYIVALEHKKAAPKRVSPKASEEQKGAGGIHPLTSKSLSTRLMYSSGDSSG